MGLIKISIDLTAIAASGKYKKSDKNQHNYINLLISDRREPDNYGNTHSVTLDRTKEEREANEPVVYVGNGKALGVPSAAPAPVAQAAGATPAPFNAADLPF